MRKGYAAVQLTPAWVRLGAHTRIESIRQGVDMTAVEVATVSYTVSAEYFARVGADFDSQAVDDAVLAELNRIVPKGVVVHRNGKAFAEPEVAAAARDIDWDCLLKRIDIDQIMATHGR
jgi:uncharacterized protein YprB with RNaseH-like and TPR domain